MPTFETEHPTGVHIEFQCQANISNAWVAKAILAGKTYVHLPFLPDVRVIFDVGANVGAAAVFFALHHPDATVHAFEPARLPRKLAKQNAEDLNIEVHPIGLSNVDEEAALFRGKNDASILGSVRPRSDVNTDVSEAVELRHGGRWAVAHGIDRIDILKVDVERAEVEVLQGLADLLPTTKAVYIEYGSRHIRREVFAILERDHELYLGSMHLDQGECVFLHKDLTDVPGSLETLRSNLSDGLENS